MFIKNNTDSHQSFKLSGKSVSMKPKATSILSEEQTKDDTLQILFARGIVSEIDSATAIKEMGGQAAKDKAAVDKKKPAVAVKEDTTAHSVIVTSCSAYLKNGKQCLANVSVPADEFSEATPYFCGKHKKEDAESYEKVNGVWIKKPEPVLEPEPAEVAEELEEEPTEEAKDVASALLR